MTIHFKPVAEPPPLGRDRLIGKIADMLSVPVADCTLCQWEGDCHCPGLCRLALAVRIDAAYRKERGDAP